MNFQFFKRMAGIISLLALAGLLQGCSAVKIFYNQLPDFAYWYLDAHLDFTESQSLNVRQALLKLQQWHRQTQLPAYIEALQKLQQQMPADMAPAQACTVFADVSHKLQAISAQVEPAMAALVPTLNARQLVQLEREFAKRNADYRSDFMEGSPKALRNKRFKQAVKRAEMLYGSLEDKQLTVLARRIDDSPFDATLSYAEKLRRQQDTLQTLKPLIAGQASPEKAQAPVRGLLERALQSPNPGYLSHFETMTQEACETWADLHNSTTAAQRGKAGETLKRYEEDFRALHAQRS